MSDSVIGALRVVLGADTAAFEDGLTKAQKTMKDFGAQMAKVGAAVGTAIGAMAVATTYAVAGTLKEFEKIGEASAQLGIPIEKLSALKYAAEVSGASFDSLGSALQALGGKLQEAAEKANSEAAHAFKALGIEVTDANGKIRSSTDVLADVAEEFEKYRDSASKTTMATKLFGESGAALIPLLNRGREGIAGLEGEARRLGLTLDDRTKDAAKAFNQNLRAIETTSGVLTTRLAAELAPVMRTLSNRLLEVARDTDGLKKANDALTTSFRYTVTLGERLAGTIRVLGTVGAQFWESLKNDKSTEEVLARQQKLWTDIQAIMDSHGKAIADIWSGAGAAVQRAGGDIAKGLTPGSKSAAELEAALTNARAALEAFVSSPEANVAEKMHAVQRAFDDGTIGMAAFLQMTQRVNNEGFKQLRDEARATFDLLVNAPTVAVAEKMQAIRDALAAGTIGMKDYGKAMDKVNKENVKNVQDLASATATALTTIFGKSKAAGVAAALINTAVGISKAFAQAPFPFDIAHAALIAATGAAQIKAITSTSMSGGGSVPSVGGGGGGAPAAAPMQQSLFVHGINPGDLFSGGQVREIAEKLLAYQRDGGRVLLQ